MRLTPAGASPPHASTNAVGTYMRVAIFSILHARPPPGRVEGTVADGCPARSTIILAIASLLAAPGLLIGEGDGTHRRAIAPNTASIPSRVSVVKRLGPRPREPAEGLHVLYVFPRLAKFRPLTRVYHPAPPARQAASLPGVLFRHGW